MAEQSFPRPRQYEDDNPSDDDDEDDVDDGYEEADWLPASHEIGWKDHGKVRYTFSEIVLRLRWARVNPRLISLLSSTVLCPTASPCRRLRSTAPALA